MDLLGGLAEESRNEKPAHPSIAIRAAGGKAAAVLLAWLHPPQGQGTEPFGPLGANQPQQSVGVSDGSASQQIDDIVRRMAGWRGERLSQLRALIRGAELKDPKGLFNTRLDSKSVRAIDFHERDAINASALKALILEGARLNRS